MHQDHETRTARHEMRAASVPRRPRPTNVAEHKAEALRCLEMSFGPYGAMNHDEYIRRAQHHLKAAQILAKLDELP